MASVLAILSKSFFEQQAQVGGRIAAIGDRVSMDRYLSANKRLTTLADGGDLFLCTVRPPDETLLLVAVLRAPSFTSAEWVATPNEATVVDVGHLIPELRFNTGKGMNPKPGRLAMSLQTPRILSEEDVTLLNTAIGQKKDSSPEPNSKPEPKPKPKKSNPKSSTTKGSKAKRSKTATPKTKATNVLSTNVLSLLTAAQASVESSPTEALTALVAAWQHTRWPRIADLVDALSEAHESEVAQSLRASGVRGNIEYKIWSMLEETLPDIDRGSVAKTFAKGTIDEVEGHVDRLRKWDPDPRAASALVGFVKQVPWVSWGSRPLWKTVLNTLAALEDPRGIDAARAFDPESIPTSSDETRQWFREHFDKMARRIETAGRTAVVAPDCEQVVESLEQALLAGESEPLQGTPLVPVPLPTVRLLQIESIAPTGVAEFQRTDDGHGLIGMHQSRSKESGEPLHWDSMAVVDCAGKTRWASDAVKTSGLSPNAEQVAAIEIEEWNDGDKKLYAPSLVLHDIATSETTPPVRLFTDERGWHGRSTRILVNWTTSEEVVVAVFKRLQIRVGIYNVQTEQYLDVINEKIDAIVDTIPAILCYEPEMGLVAVALCSHLFIVDQQRRRVVQAMLTDKQLPSQRVVSVLPVGRGCFAIHTHVDSLFKRGQAGGSFVAVMHGQTGWIEREVTLAPMENIGRMKSGALAAIVRDGKTLRARSLANKDLATSRDDEKTYSISIPVPKGEATAVPQISGELTVAVGDAVVRWDLESGSEELRYPVGLPCVERVAVNAGGSVVGVLSHYQAHLLHGDKPICIRSKSFQGISDIALDAKGNMAVAVNTRAEIRSPAGKKVGVLKAGRAYLHRLVGHPTQPSFAAVTDQQVVLFDNTQAIVHGFIASASCAAFDVTGERLVAAGGSQLWLWEVNNGRELTRISLPAPLAEIALWGDGLHAAGLHRTDDGGQLYSINLATGEVCVVSPQICAMAVHATKPWIALADNIGRVWLRTFDGASECDVGQHFAPSSLAFSDDSLFVGAGLRGHGGSVVQYTLQEVES